MTGGSHGEAAWLVFAVNGERFELRHGDFDPGMTLLEFLRTRTRFRGVKLGCGEGGCGACVVLLSMYDPISEQVKDFSVSSCLTLIGSINYCSVTTTEGLGNTKNGFHSIHHRFAGFHASQCGYCTPGMCMSLFSALINADRSSRLKPPDGFSKLTSQEAEKAISGNLCRCTGYRPILDACKSFAADIDLEDLGLNSFWKKGSKDVTVANLPSYKAGLICTYPDFLKLEKSKLDNMNLPKNGLLLGESWFYPGSISELHKLLNHELLRDCRLKMIVGNTASGVYRDHGMYDMFIDLKGIPELTFIKRDPKGIEIGSATSISTVIELLREEGCKNLVYLKIADHLEKVASHFVRNMASLGGNLMMAQRDQFPSDIATVLLAAGATVCLWVSSEKSTITIEEFLEIPPSDQRTLLLSIFIPSWHADGASNTKHKLLFETYRAAPRPLGNAVAYLNSAFVIQVFVDELSRRYVLQNTRLAFGAYGVEHAVRARKVENILEGKPLSASLLLEACHVLRQTVVAQEGTRHAAYRSTLAVSFLFNFLQPFVECLPHPELSLHENGSMAIHNAGIVDDLNGFPYNSSKSMNLLLSAEQTIGFSNDYLPVGKPTNKAGAELQASGEAVYVDDIPAPKDCLYGAFLYSTKPMARIDSIELGEQHGISIVTAKDIPAEGQNIGAAAMFGSDPLFADSISQFAGQPIGIVIAETQRAANIAAKNLVVNYCTENLDMPILSIEDAVERNSFFNVPPFLDPRPIGDFSQGMAQADHQILSAVVKLPSQYYFYMETQTALAVPDEDNCVVVYSSVQTTEKLQEVIAVCLGIPIHNVRVITRRVGGGFGGKAIRAQPVATACALAAFKLGQPVRMYLDRKTDIVTTAGRHPMKIVYSVGFQSDGKVTALHLDVFINAGFTEDISPIVPHNFTGTLKKYNWGALSLNFKVCKTNVSSKSAMRAPGELQGNYVAEAVIEHVASFLAVDPNLVRKRNLHSCESLALFYAECSDVTFGYTLPSIFTKLSSSEIYQQHVEKTISFNSANKWRKRGISCVPLVYRVTVLPSPGKVSILKDGSVVVEVGGIELGQGLWTKVKQMAAFGLEQLWSSGSQDLLGRIRVIQADSLSLTQGGWTAGSTASESNCEAVRLSCNILVDRLKALKETLEQQQGTVSWEALISQAHMASIDLSARAFFVPEQMSSNYLNYGACTSEVEVDLLTGAVTILRSDLIYDCGQSLNPAVDLGQVEGAFVQGIGFFMTEEYLTNSDGLTVSDSTWSYKIPTVDTIPKQFNVELVNSGHHRRRVLSSKASGEPPLVLASSVHCATRQAIKAARQETGSLARSDISPLIFDLPVPATMPIVKELCGLGIVEKHLEDLVSRGGS